MKFITSLFSVLLMSNLLVSDAHAVEEKHYDIVIPIIEAFKNNDKELISTFVKYPLKRKKPLSPIENKAEFLSRYDELFDKDFMALISRSSLRSDWDAVGWRGIMFSKGLLWLDTDGNIISVNYESNIERTLKKGVISEQKRRLHNSINNYAEPLLSWETKKFHLRIDRLEDDTFRYAAWPIGKKTSEEPALVLYNGEHKFDGSGGNHHYTFKNGKYTYICYVNRLGTANSPPGLLQVFKGKEILLSEEVTKSHY